MNGGYMRWVVLGLVTVTVVSVMGLIAIAVAQVVFHEPINLPAGLTEALGVEIAALFGGQLFLGHTQAIGGLTATMNSIARNTIPSDVVTAIPPPTGSPASGGASDTTTGTTATSD